MLERKVQKQPGGVEQHGEAGDDWRVDGVTRLAGLPLAQIPPQLSQAVKGARYTPMVYAVPNCGTIVILTSKITRSANKEL